MLTTLATRYPAAIHTCPMAPGAHFPLPDHSGRAGSRDTPPLNPGHTVLPGCLITPLHKGFPTSSPRSEALHEQTSWRPGHLLRLWQAVLSQCIQAAVPAGAAGRGTVLTSPEPLDCGSRQIYPSHPAEDWEESDPGAPHLRTRRHKSLRLGTNPQRFGTNLRSERAGAQQEMLIKLGLERKV